MLDTIVSFFLEMQLLLVQLHFLTESPKCFSKWCWVILDGPNKVSRKISLTAASHRKALKIILHSTVLPAYLGLH